MSGDTQLITEAVKRLTALKSLRLCGIPAVNDESLNEVNNKMLVIKVICLCVILISNVVLSLQLSILRYFEAENHIILLYLHDQQRKPCLRLSGASAISI